MRETRKHRDVVIGDSLYVTAIISYSIVYAFNMSMTYGLQTRMPTTLKEIFKSLVA
jgi:hypothetical protein